MRTSQRSHGSCDVELPQPLPVWYDPSAQSRNTDEFDGEACPFYQEKFSEVLKLDQDAVEKIASLVESPSTPGQHLLPAAPGVSDLPIRIRPMGMLKLIPESHLDHNLSPAQVAYIVQKYATKDSSSLWVETFELPAELGTVPCALHGPIMGEAPVPEDEVFYARRGNRKGESRMCRRPMQPTRFVTVVAGPEGSDPCVLYTAYGGPCAPREPWDTGDDEESEQFSSAFWAQHALSAT